LGLYTAGWLLGAQQRRSGYRYKGIEAAKDIPAGPYADYGNPERIVLNVNVLYKEFAGDPEPVNPVEQFAAMARWQA